MRRFMAFLITVVTVIAIFAINVIGYGGSTGSMDLQTDFTLGLDYRGGYEVLYTVTGEENAQDEAIETIIVQAEAAGLNDFDVSKEDNNQIRVTFPASSKAAAESVLGILESNCELTFRKTDDTSLLDEGVTAYDALLTTRGDKAEITTDSNGNIAIQLNLSQDGKEEFNSWITDGKLSKIEDESSENYGGTEEVVIWFGYTEYDEEAGEEKVDSYEEYKSLRETGVTFLNSENRIKYKKYENKILSVASISADLVSQGGLESRDFMLTGNFTRAKANSIIEIINNGGLDYTLERESFARVPASEGSASITTTIIALSIGILAICLFLMFVYRLPGVGAAVTLLAQVGLSLLIYRTFNGLFGPEVIVALLVSVVVAVDSFVCLFERAKDEMFKGKTIERSFDEATKKTNSTIIDSVILSLIVSLIIFAVGSGTIRSIATMLAVSMAICLVLTTLLIKLLSNCIYKSLKFEGKYNYFTKKHKQVPNVKNGEHQSFFGYFTNVNFFKNLKKKFKFVGIGLLAALLCGTVWTVVDGSPLNLGNDFNKYTKVTIQTNLTDEDLAELDSGDLKIEFVNDKKEITEESITNFIKNKTGVKPKEVLLISDKTIDPNSSKEIKFTSVVVNFSNVVDNDDLKELEEYFKSLKDKADELNTGSTSYVVNEHVFTFSCNKTENVTARKTVLNATLAFGLAIIAVLVYVSFRYKFTYALAISAGLLADAILVIGALLITHLSFSILTATCILGITCYSVNDKVKYFDRVRENLKGSRKKVFTHEEYVEYSNKALQQSLLRSLIVGALSILMLIVIMVSSLFNYTLFAIVLSLGIVASVFTSFFVVPRVWIAIEDKWAVIMQNKTHKTKKKVKFEEIEEQVFIGIND